jgi:RNA polymerase sigma-70 factor, ECF subfamily
MKQLSIFERIARGDDAAIRECMDLHGGLVWSLARRWSETAADAEDASQEIFLELWKSAHRYDPAVASEAVFVATIARRRLIDRLRSNRRRPRMETFDERFIERVEETHAGSVAADGDRARRALAQLPSAQREVLMMGIVEGMTHSEIAAVTGRPLGTVKTQLRRGLIRIRELMEPKALGPEDTS